MGIKNFSQTFNSTRIVKLKDLKHMTIAIDAMSELYRASLGSDDVKKLTDRDGNPTIFISVTLLNIFKLHLAGVKQIWVFDHDRNGNAEFHNPAKLDELVRRKKKKEDAAEKIKKLIEEEPLFSDDEEDVVEEKKVIDTEVEADELLEAENPKSKSDPKSKLDQKSKSDPKSKLEQIKSLEKRVFSVNSRMIEELKLILNCLNIQWTEAPAGFEGEAIASYLNSTSVVNAVYSGDTDPIAFGAPVLLRTARDKKIYEYTQEDVLKQIAESNDEFEEPTLSDFLKAAVALGTDMADKTPGIGAKTVLKKLHTIKLTKKQKEAIEHFKKRPTTESIVIHNSDKTPFVDCPIDNLIRWLVDSKNFRESLWRPRFEDTIAGKTKEKKSSKSKSTKKPSKKPAKKPTKKTIEPDKPIILDFDENDSLYAEEDSE
jgi:hypothetical protein